MANGITLNVRVNSALAEHIEMQIGKFGLYENASEYVRALIRQDLEMRDGEMFAAHRPIIERALETPREDYLKLTVDDIVERAQARRTQQADIAA